SGLGWWRRLGQRNRSQDRAVHIRGIAERRPGRIVFDDFLTRHPGRDHDRVSAGQLALTRRACRRLWPNIGAIDIRQPPPARWRADPYWRVDRSNAARINPGLRARIWILNV